MVEQVYYHPQPGITPEIWKERMIRSLSPHEGFMENKTRLHGDTAKLNLEGARNVQVIRDMTGSAMATFNHQVTGPDGILKNWYSVSGTSLFMSSREDASGKPRPVFVHKDSLAQADIGLVVLNSLSGIPRSSTQEPINANDLTVKKIRVTAEFTPIWGFVHSSSMNVIGTLWDYNSTVTFKTDAVYGIEIGIGVTKQFDVMVSFLREGTLFTLKNAKYADTNQFKVGINYILIGVNYNFRVGRALSPYAGFCIGSLNMIPKDHYYRDVWCFSLKGEAGLKIYLNRWFGMRMQADLYYQLWPTGGPFIYSDDPKNKPVDSGSGLLQFGLTGGAIFRLGN